MSVSAEVRSWEFACRENDCGRFRVGIETFVSSVLQELSVSKTIIIARSEIRDFFMRVWKCEYTFLSVSLRVLGLERFRQCAFFFVATPIAFFIERRKNDVETRNNDNAKDRTKYHASCGG